MVASTWRERELPILEAVLRHEQTGEDFVQNVEALAEVTGLEEGACYRGTIALIDANPPYLTAELDQRHLGETRRLIIGIQSTERARRAAGQWPSDDAGAVLIEILEERLAGASNEEERTRWARMLESAKALGARALTEVAIAYAERYAPGLGPGH